MRWKHKKAFPKLFFVFNQHLEKRTIQLLCQKKKVENTLLTTVHGKNTTASDGKILNM